MAVHIVVVEDNAANLELISYLLRAYGYDVTEAVTGAEGLDAVTGVKPDLVLLDLQLPDMDGFAVLDAIRSDPERDSVPIVAVTALAMVGDRERVMKAGFDGYITKPIEPETFIEQVEALIDRPDLPAGRWPVPAEVVDTGVTHNGARDHLGALLVVDDNAVNIRVLRETLEPSGYVVLAASNIRDAAALAMQRRPDVVLSDIHIGSESGFDLLRMHRAAPELCEIPFGLMTSGGANPDLERRLDAAAPDLVLYRPLEPDVLLEKVGRVLRARKA